MGTGGEQSAATDFDRAIAVEPVDRGGATAEADGPGRSLYTGAIDLGWSAPTGPNGGYLAAIVVNALQLHIAPGGERQLRSLTCHYLRPAREGPLDIEVETVRSGRRFSTARLTARQDGKETLTALTAFSSGELAAAATWSPTPPDIGPPPDRAAPREPIDSYAPGTGAWLLPSPDMPPIIQKVKISPQLGDPPFAGREPAAGEAVAAAGWIELPEPRVIDAAYVALLTDIWWPPALAPLSTPAIAPTVDLTIHVRARLPAAGLPDQPVLGHYRTSAAVGGLIEEDGVLFLADGTLLAQSRQLALLAPLQ